MELLEYDAKGKLISPIGILRAKGIDVGTIVTTAGNLGSWQVLSVSKERKPYVWLTYCGAAATMEMCIKEFADAYPEPRKDGKPSAATASAANVAAILTPAAELEAAKAKALDKKTKEATKNRGVPLDEFLQDWEHYAGQKGYAIHPKWPVSRPIATKVLAASGVRGYLLSALHKAVQASDETIHHGRRITVFNKPKLEVRCVAGSPPRIYGTLECFVARRPHLRKKAV